MDAEKLDQAAGILAAAFTGGQRLERLPSECAPNSHIDALAIQERLAKCLNEKVAGWKGAVWRDDKLIYGAVMSSRLWPSPARVSAQMVPMRGIEAEIAFRFERDLPQRSEPYRSEEIADYVSAAVAIEIVDTRFADYDAAPFWDRTADFMSNGGLVLGSGPADWRARDLSKLTVVLSINGQERVRQIGGHARHDPFLPAVDLANAFTREGSIAAGMVITTGTLTGLIRTEPNDSITAELIGFGRAELRFIA